LGCWLSFDDDIDMIEDDVISARRWPSAALVGITVVLALGVAGCGDGNGNGAVPSRGASGSGSSPAASTGPASPAEQTGLLYAAKSVTFSGTWAAEHGCPVNLYIDFTDSGPGSGIPIRTATAPRRTGRPGPG